MELMFQPLKRYFDFQGRARRMEFWLWYLFNLLVSCAFYLMLAPFGGDMHMDPLTGAMVMPTGIGMGILIVQWLYSLAVFIPNLAVSVRRLHDINRSGWWLLLVFTVIGIVVLLIFDVMAGTRGPNRFGPDPITGEGGSAETFA